MFLQTVQILMQHFKSINLIKTDVKLYYFCQKIAKSSNAERSTSQTTQTVVALIADFWLRARLLLFIGNKLITW